MEWFKHSTGSHDDPDVSDAMDEFGHSAYSVFFISLEIYGSEFNHLDSDGWLTLSKRFVARKLRLSSGKVEQILNFFSDRNRIIIKTDEHTISLKCPKFIDISSNWTKRKIPPPTEGLQRDSVAPTAKEEEVEEKKNRIKKVKKESDIYFEQFYNLYPLHKKKPEALKAWKKYAISEEMALTIIDGLRKHLEFLTHEKERGFCPYPASWLNANSWEDEVIDFRRAGEKNPPRPGQRSESERTIYPVDTEA